MVRKIFLQFLFFLVLFSCTEEDRLPSGTQLLLNPNLSLYPDSVFPWSPLISNKIEYGVSKDVFLTGNRSLFIENQDSLIASSATWTQTYTGPMPSPGSTVELYAFLKGENIRDLTAGGKINIFFRVLPGGPASGNELELKGDFDWVPLKATLDNFPKDAEGIQVYLNMPTLTLGKVYFDEINLIAK